MNKFIVSGRTTKDLILEQTKNGTPVTTIPLAENYIYMKDGQKVEGVNYFHILSYGVQAKNAAEYCGKGSYLIIEAKISNANYEKNGQLVYKDQIIANRIEYGQLKSPGGVNKPADPPAFFYDPEQELG